MQPSVAGIFVGGAATRMGGLPKGLLRVASGETILSRLRAIFDRLAIPVVLVGASDAYAAERLRSLTDVRSGIGPLGGLLALLAHAGEGPAIGVGCDMPFVTDGLVERLVSAPPASAVAPRSESGSWEPLFARWDPRAILPIAIRHADAGVTSLQRLLDAASAHELVLDPSERRSLRDWDAPSDIESDVQ